MDIVLVNPGGDLDGSGLQAADMAKTYMYPYSIVYLYNYLKKHKVESKVFDLYVEKADNFFDYLKDLQAPIVGVTAQTYSSMAAVELIRRVKSINPKSIVVVGGEHFGYCAQDVLTNVEEVDIVVKGEGEVTFLELVLALSDNKSISSIEGIVYRRPPSIIANKDRDPVKDLEEFTLDYNTLPYKELFSTGVYMRNFEKEGIKSFPVYLGRGCPQKCVFCTYNRFAYRTRSLNAVLDEIRFLKKKYNRNYFTFSDPSFCERRPFVKDFCDSLIRENFNIKWYCEVRVDMPFELLDLMAKAGCVSLDFALESGSARVLKAIRKKISPQRAIDFAKHCHSLGIRSHVFAMISLPGEREEDAYRTLDTIKKLSPYCSSMSMAVAQIHPGTELEKIARENKALPEGFSYYDSNFFHNYSDICNTNVPLYIENLSIDFIRSYLKEVNDIRAAEYDSMYHLLKRSLAGVKTIHKRSFKKNVEYISRFFRALRVKFKKSNA